MPASPVQEPPATPTSPEVRSAVDCSRIDVLLYSPSSPARLDIQEPTARVGDAPGSPLDDDAPGSPDVHGSGTPMLDDGNVGNPDKVRG